MPLFATLTSSRAGLVVWRTNADVIVHPDVVAAGVAGSGCVTLLCVAPALALRRATLRDELVAQAEPKRVDAETKDCIALQLTRNSMRFHVCDVRGSDLSENPLKSSSAYSCVCDARVAHLSENSLNSSRAYSCV